MSSTRHAAAGSPLSQERYMSSPEYLELRGISGSAVTVKAALLAHPTKRSLLFFLQAMSLQPGGLQKFTRDFMEMFQNRIGTPTMHKAGMKANQIYDRKTIAALSDELDERTLADLLDIHREEREHVHQVGAAQYVEICHERLAHLPEYIVELCINPRLRFSVPGESADALKKEQRRLDEQLRDEEYRRTFNSPEMVFQDIIGALFEFKRRYEEQARRDFVTTEVAAKSFEVLDLSLATGKMVVIQGESRIGKTTATEAWCQQHLGEARFVSLNGIRNYSGVFRAIAKALGLPSGHAHSTTKIQARIEDMLQKSRLLLIIDEAHYLLSAAERTRTAPELIDWVNTALCNHGVPVALVCTPQLTLRMARHEHQAGWNADQWRGRVKRFCMLPAIPKTEDLRAVAKKHLPESSKPIIDYIVGYALSSKLHMPAVIDVIDEARLLAQRDGRTQITFADVERAVLDYCAPSAAAMISTFRVPTAQKGRKQREANPGRQLPEDMKLSLMSSRSGGTDARCNQKTEALTERETQVRILPRSSLESANKLLTPG
jgi:hypothetical protein